jgi:hypothetical protein
MRPGDTVYPARRTALARRRPDDFMTHPAMWEAPAPDSNVPETEWGALVTDEEYNKS